MIPIDLLCKGFVVVQVTGDQIDRFLNLCHSHDLRLFYLDKKATETYATLSVQDFYRIKNLKKKTHVRIHIKSKKGIPFLLYKLKRRKRILLYIILILLILVFLSTRIWCISIEGNIRNSTSDLFLFLQENDIYAGMPRKKIHCQKIASEIRKAYPDIAWVSVKQNGQKLSIELKEAIKTTPQKAEEQGFDLVSGIEGTISKIITRNGVPLKKTGDVVKKGECLVSGCIPYYNDDQIMLKEEYRCADADIWIEYEVPYYNEFSKKYYVLEEEKQEYSMLRFEIGSCAINMPLFNQNFFHKKNADSCIIKEKSCQNILRICHPFLRMNISIEKSIFYKKCDKEYTEEEAKREAQIRLEKYIKNLIEKGVQISVNNVTIKVSDFGCVAKGSLFLIEKTGVRQPVKVHDPRERKTEDGE